MPKSCLRREDGFRGFQSSARDSRGWSMESLVCQSQNRKHVPVGGWEVGIMNLQCQDLHLLPPNVCSLPKQCHPLGLSAQTSEPCWGTFHIWALKLWKWIISWICGLHMFSSLVENEHLKCNKKPTHLICIALKTAIIWWTPGAQECGLLANSDWSFSAVWPGHWRSELVPHP